MNNQNEVGTVAQVQTVQPEQTAQTAQNGVSGSPKLVANVVMTSNIYLATLIGTLGCQPLTKLKGPEQTRQGKPVTKFVYSNMDGVAKDIFVAWGKTTQGYIPSWSEWTPETRQVVIDVVTSFAHNLPHFLAEVKTAK